MAKTKSPDQRMSDDRAERVAIAEELEERLKNPLDTCHRVGGYFLSSAGIPQDANGITLPEEEWKPEDLERIKGKQAIPEAGELAPTRKDGADVVEGSGSEKRGRGAQRPR